MPTKAENNKATVVAFFKAIEAKKPKLISALFADDGVHINPYHPVFSLRVPRVGRLSTDIGNLPSLILME